jgi:hypothetical protein
MGPLEADSAVLFLADRKPKSPRKPNSKPGQSVHDIQRAGHGYDSRRPGGYRIPRRKIDACRPDDRRDMDFLGFLQCSVALQDAVLNARVL